MDLNKMTKAELETLSYTDLAFYILKDNKKTMNTPSIFKKICELLEYSDDEYTSKIGDFYTSLTTDKRFILLDNAEWDLRDNHSIKIAFDEEEEEIDEEDVEEESDETEEQEENIDSEIDDDDLMDDDDMDDLEIIDEDEELEEN